MLHRRLLLACALAAAGCDPAPPAGASDVAATTSGGWLKGTDAERFATLERHLRGFDMAMVEVGHRYAELRWAGEDRNWGYALYQAGKIRTSIANASERRPARAESARTIEAPLQIVEAAARAEDPVAFDLAFVGLTERCNACHEAEGVAFAHVVPPPLRASVVRWPPR